MRLAEMSSMGIGNKPCLDIRPSADQISDRSISIAQLSKSKFDNMQAYKGVSKSFWTVDNEINSSSSSSNNNNNNNNNNNDDDDDLLRSNTKVYGSKLYHLQFSLEVASLETFGYTLMFVSKNKEFCIELIKPTFVLH
jgi:hypothetical protein